MKSRSNNKKNIFGPKSDIISMAGSLETKMKLTRREEKETFGRGLVAKHQDDPLLKMVGMGKSNKKNLSENVNEIYFIDRP